MSKGVLVLQIPCGEVSYEFEIPRDDIPNEGGPRRWREEGRRGRGGEGQWRC